MSLWSFMNKRAPEYDAAFDLYLERSPDAALRFDAEVDQGEIQVLAIAHTSRKPGYWKERL